MPLCTIFTKCPAPAGPQCSQPSGGARSLERGREVGDRLVGPADHEAVADLVAPDAAGGAGVDEHDAALGQRGRAALAVGEARVAAVDDDVALAQQARELVDRLLGDVPRRHHHPDGAATLAEVRDELVERGSAGVPPWLASVARGPSERFHACTS